MNPLRLSVRFPVDRSPDDLEPALEVFHRFLQRGLVEGLILDVADYRHVPDGPGVMLIGHDVDYGISHRAFTVVRKRSAHDPAAQQLRDALRMGLGALDAIADDGGLGVSVDRSRFIVTVPDRRLGPADQVAEALRAELEPVLAEVLGAGASLSIVDRDPRAAAAVAVRSDPQAAGELLAKLGGSQAPGQSPWDISVEELARLRTSDADFILLDVREPNEYDTVNLGGRLAPLASLGEAIADLDRGTRIVAHCRAGTRGAKAVAQLRDAGFDDVWNVNGGLMAWIDRIDPSLPRY